MERGGSRRWAAWSARPRLADVLLLVVAIPLVAAQAFVLLTLVVYGFGGDLSSDAGIGSRARTVAFLAGANLVIHAAWRATARAKAASGRSEGPR